jgi:DNA repair protein RadC
MKQTVLDLGLPARPRRRNLVFNPKEYRVQTLRECPTPAELQLCETPDKAAAYWRDHVPDNPYFNRDVESFIVLLLNTRRRIIGHHLAATGTLDTLLVHPREVFRVAIIGAAAAVVLLHNHPSGESSPSEADIRFTRDLIRAGQLLKLEILDHVIIGEPDETNPKGYHSLRELGYFYQ